MGDLLRQGSSWLEQMRVAHFSSPVTYRRGNMELAVNATFAATAAEVDDGTGIRIQTYTADFLVAAAELGPLGKPQAGDRIAAGGATFEVLPLGGEDCWRWSDRYMRTYRIHTKQADQEQG